MRFRKKVLRESGEFDPQWKLGTLLKAKIENLSMQ